MAFHLFEKRNKPRELAVKESNKEIFKESYIDRGEKFFD